MLFQILVQHSPHKDKQDAEIEPQHKEDNGSKASVGGGEAVKGIDIERVQIREDDPQEGGKAGSGKLIPEGSFVLGHKAVQEQEIDDECEK